LENFSQDVKRARLSLLNSNQAIPQFPQPEWLNLLSGNAINLDHLLHGSLTPAKTVKTHGDWVIAWEALVEATLFIFRHCQQELLLYGKHIQRFFASLPAQFHSQVIHQL
ncbi:hypothetical protein L208DRAFT_1236957, partial [Tricholoma matsutake]